MQRLFCFLAMVGLVGFLDGCAEGSPQTTTVELPQPQQPQTTGIAEDGELGDGVRIKFISARGSHDQMQTEVQRQMETFINAGQNEIVRVSTTRCNGGDAHLLSAEVYYRPKK